ncbi:MAG: hypothetical protein ACOZHQ_11350 [Thermodesulfobacteriota bacterium]
MPANFIARRWFLLPLLLALLGLAGCGRQVTVNAYLDPARAQGLFPGARFAVLPQADQRSDPLLEREVADKIGLVLTSSMYRLDTTQTAEYLLTYAFDAEMSQGAEMRAVHEPGRKVKVTTERDGKKVTKEVEEPGYTRYEPRLVTRHFYRLRLAAYLNQAQGQPRRDLAVWSAEVSTADTQEGFYSQGNLRDALNYLIVGGLSVLGQAGPEPVSFLVKDDDPRLKLIRRR